VIEHQDDILPPIEGHLRSELEALYDVNTDDNILEQLNINSNCYDIDELSKHATNSINHRFKYNALHINIQGLLSSIDKLKHMINKLERNNISIDFILICETFLNGHDQECHCNIPGYDFVCKNRKYKAKGGIGIFVKNKYKFKIRDDISTFIEGEYESIFIEIISKPHNAIVGEIYRIPNTPIQLSLDRYEDSINKLLTKETHDIIVGSDQNLDYLKINEHKHTSDLFNNFISNGLIPVITKPTRITHNTATLIDNIYILN